MKRTSIIVHMICVASVMIAGCGDRGTSAGSTAATADAAAADSVAAQDIVPGASAQASPAAAVREQPDSVVVYEHVYEYNTATMIENHYIQLAFHRDTVTGRYFGTTDDFDSAREGYLPGFFATTMNDLRILQNTISFILAPWDYFTTPRTPAMDPDAPTTDLTRWKVTTDLTPSRSYFGEITADRITIQSPFGPREFKRMPGDSRARN